jgi:hypothetical protein
MKRAGYDRRLTNCGSQGRRPGFNVFSHNFQSDWPHIDESFAAQSPAGTFGDATSAAIQELTTIVMNLF